MKTYLIIFFIFLISASITAQTIENPLEQDDEIMMFYDFNVQIDKVYFIYTNASASIQYIFMQSYVNNQWVRDSNLVQNGNVFSNLETTRQFFGAELKHNPKIVFDNNGNLWITGNALYKKISSNLWKMYNPPRKEENEDTTVVQVLHEVYFNKQNQPTVSSRISSNGSKYKGPRVNFFEIFKLVNDTLRHTRIDNKIDSLKTSSAHLVDESKMTAVNDTIVVYKPNGMFYFIKPDFSYDSVAFVGYSGKTSSNLEIRQIQPEGGLNKLWVLADKSTSSSNSSERCCSGLYLLENKNQWTVFDESNGMPKNTDGSFYAPRSIIKLPNGNHLVALSPDTNSGRYSELYTIDATKKLTRVSLENFLKDSRVFPRSQFYRGITNETFTKIFTAIRTNTITEPIPFTEILKIRLDGSGNLWWVMKDCIVMIPSFIPTSVVEENTTNSSVIVIPNPSTNSISLQTVPSSFEKIDIVSVHGQIVQTVTSNFQTINIQSLPSGVYLLKIHSKSGIQTTTFIKEF